MRKLLCLLPLIVAIEAGAQSSVWKVTRGDSVLYLGGACHVLRKSDLPLPKEYDQAFNASSLIAFETDFKELQNPQTQFKLMAAGRYPPGETLEKNLSPSTLTRLKAAAKKAGLPFEALNPQKPSMVMLMLSMVELRRLGVSERGVDFILHDRASKANKKTLGLESIETQIRTLTTLGMENPDQLIEHTLRDTSRIGGLMEAIIGAWRKGDRKILREIFVDQLKKEYPAFHKKLLADRNRSWMPQLERLLGTKDVEFVLVGAGHIVGEEGVIALLEKAGCKVEQLTASKD